MIARVAPIAVAALAAGSAIAAPHQLQKRCSGGQATFYDVGQGNCGGYNKPSDYVVALPTGMYGSTSQQSGWCNQQVTITNTNNGKTATATIVDSCPSCPNSCSLDMSTSLFSFLNDGNMGAGVFPITWSSGGGGSGSSSNSNSGSKSSNNNNNNNNNNNQQQQSQSNNNNNQQSSSSSSSSSDNKPSSSSSSSSSAPKAQTTPKNVPYSAPAHATNYTAPAGKANSTVATAPQWWAEIDAAYCNIQTPPSNVSVAAVGPSKYYNGANLSDVCGNWINVYNPANKKNVTALVVEWIPDIEDNFLALTDGYKKIADMQGSNPNPIANVTWGFVYANTTSLANKTESA